MARWVFPDRLVDQLGMAVGMHLSSSRAFSSSRVLNRSRGVKKRVRVSRRKGGSRQCIRSGDELREFPKLRKESTGLFVFMTERGALFTPDSFDWLVKRAGERRSTTGMLRNLPDVMRSMRLETVSLSLQVSTFRVIVWLTGSSSGQSRTGHGPCARRTAIIVSCECATLARNASVFSTHLTGSSLPQNDLVGPT
jgi:hypothetical protein